MKKYPLKVSYTPKSAIWAGSRLAAEWGKIGESERIADTLSKKEREAIENFGH